MFFESIEELVFESSVEYLCHVVGRSGSWVNSEGVHFDQITMLAL